MKNLLLLFPFLFILSCGMKSATNQSKTLPGKWEAIEQYLSIGGPAEWKAMENSVILEFQEDSTFVETIKGMERKGGYEIEEEKVVLTFENSIPKSITYNYRWDKNGRLILGNAGCIEPCELKYKRLK